MPAGADRGRRARPQGAARRSRTAFARAPRAGASCCSACGTGTAWALDPELATGDGALGFWQALHEVWPKTRQQRCWVHKTANVLDRLPRPCRARPSRTCTPSTRPRTARRPRTPSTASSPSMAPSTTRPPPAWPRTARRCSPSTTSPPSTGSTSGPATRSRAPSPPSGCGPTRPRAACHGRPRWRWSSSSPSRPSGTGAGWTARERLAQVIQGVRFRDGEPVQDAEDQAAA